MYRKKRQFFSGTKLDPVCKAGAEDGRKSGRGT